MWVSYGEGVTLFLCSPVFRVPVPPCPPALMLSSSYILYSHDLMPSCPHTPIHPIPMLPQSQIPLFPYIAISLFLYVHIPLFLQSSILYTPTSLVFYFPISPRPYALSLYFSSPIFPYSLMPLCPIVYTLISLVLYHSISLVLYPSISLVPYFPTSSSPYALYPYFSSPLSPYFSRDLYSPTTLLLYPHIPLSIIPKHTYTLSKRQYTSNHESKSIKFPRNLKPVCSIRMSSTIPEHTAAVPRRTRNRMTDCKTQSSFGRGVVERSGRPANRFPHRCDITVANQLRYRSTSKSLLACSVRINQRHPPF